MQKVILLIGLPGSGKTTYIEQHPEIFSGFVICDDYHKSTLGKSRDFTDSSYYQDVQNALTAGKSIVMSDIAWCKSERLNIVVSGLRSLIKELDLNLSINFIYFENNPQVCKKNALHRGRADRIDRELELIDRLSENYYIPDNATIISILDASAIK